MQNRPGKVSDAWTLEYFSEHHRKAFGDLKFSDYESVYKVAHHFFLQKNEHRYKVRYKYCSERYPGLNVDVITGDIAPDDGPQAVAKFESFRKTHNCINPYIHASETNALQDTIPANTIPLSPPSNENIAAAWQLEFSTAHHQAKYGDLKKRSDYESVFKEGKYYYTFREGQKCRLQYKYKSGSDDEVKVDQFGELVEKSSKGYCINPASFRRKYDNEHPEVKDHRFLNQLLIQSLLPQGNMATLNLLSTDTINTETPLGVPRMPSHQEVIVVDDASPANDDFTSEIMMSPVEILHAPMEDHEKHLSQMSYQEPCSLLDFNTNEADVVPIIDFADNDTLATIFEITADTDEEALKLPPTLPLEKTISTHVTQSMFYHQKECPTPAADITLADILGTNEIEHDLGGLVDNADNDTLASLFLHEADVDDNSDEQLTKKPRTTL